MNQLKGIYDDHDFVCGVMSNCGGEDAWAKLYNYIVCANEHGESISSDEKLILSLVLGVGKGEELGKVKKKKGMMVASL